MDKKKSTNEWGRHRVQILWAFLTNSYLVGFAKGKIYQGKLKNLCVPGLNCYSCPGALGACPIGAMQAVVGSWNFKLAFYVAGFLMFVGALLGRFVCGWLCPFGLIQDLLPLVLLNQGMRSAIGWLYAWKNLLLAVIIILSVIIYRPFCKYICPLGAVYSLFQPISVFRYRVDQEACTHCGACAKICKMQVDPSKSPNHMECIRCGQCIKVCPTSAITSNIRRNKKQ